MYISREFVCRLSVHLYFFVKTNARTKQIMKIELATPLLTLRYLVKVNGVFVKLSQGLLELDDYHALSSGKGSF
jgi:hypothetical protein